MVGPDWRVGLWTFLSIPAGTAAWACLILFGAPDDGGDTIRQVVVVIGAVIALITMGTYLSTACTDPGIVFKHEAASVTSSLPEQRFLGGRSSTVAPTGAGTPVSQAPGAASAQDFGEKSREKAAASGAVAVEVEGKGEEVKGDGAWKMEDIEAQQMLDILTDEYRKSGKADPAAPPAGLPASECAAAVDAGSTAVIDMRNAPPPIEPVQWVPPEPPASTRQGDTRVGGAETTMCGRCQIERPAEAVHCTRCGVCVDKLDHHCPFMGQCVGRKTLVQFYAFIVAIWCLVFYVLAAVGYLVVAVVVSGV
eukprot:jgi/Undpi1/12672/HiC_scaffold_6.g02340.m1